MAAESGLAVELNWERRVRRPGLGLWGAEDALAGRDVAQLTARPRHDGPVDQHLPVGQRPARRAAAT